MARDEALIAELLTGGERWLPVVGYEGFYEISDFGRLRSVDRKARVCGGDMRPVSGALMTPQPSNGYLRVMLSNGKGKASVAIHRLVLEAFVGPCPPGMQCRHFPDRTRTNNRLENLSWGTRIENAADMTVHGTRFIARGELCGKAKLTAKQVIEMRRRRVAGESTIDLAASFGVTSMAVSNICNGLRWAWLKDEEAA